MKHTVVALGAILLVVAGSASGAARTSFADGRWSGTSSVSQLLESAVVRGTGTLALRVRDGRAAGTLTVKGTVTGMNDGKRVTVGITGRFVLGGPAAKPAGRGTITVGSKPDEVTAPLLVALSAMRGTCDRVAGKVVLSSPKPAESDGPSSLAAPFSANRVPGSGPRC